MKLIGPDILALNCAGSQKSQLPFLNIHNPYASSLLCSFARIHARPQKLLLLGFTCFSFYEIQDVPILLLRDPFMF